MKHFQMTPCDIDLELNTKIVNSDFVATGAGAVVV